MLYSFIYDVNSGILFIYPWAVQLGGTILVANELTIWGYSQFINQGLFKHHLPIVYNGLILLQWEIIPTQAPAWVLDYDVFGIYW